MNEKKLKPFDWEAVKSGAQVVTRDRRQARFITEIKSENHPLVFAISNGFDGEESIYTATRTGKFYRDGEDSDLDLFILPKTVTITRYLTVFIDEKGIFPGSLYETEEEALRYPGDNIKPIKIEIEYEE